jgi:hypothetical protein
MKSPISIDKCSIICNDGSTLNKGLHQSGTRAHLWPERSHLSIWRGVLSPGLSGIVQPPLVPDCPAYSHRRGGGDQWWLGGRVSRGGGGDQWWLGGRASRGGGGDQWWLGGRASRGGGGDQWWLGGRARNDWKVDPTCNFPLPLCVSLRLCVRPSGPLTPPFARRISSPTIRANFKLIQTNSK